MVCKSRKYIALLAAVLLIVGLALLVSPRDAYAADYNAPDPEDIYMDYNYNSSGHFTSTKLYYSSSSHQYTTDGGDSGYDAWYRPETGTLYLWNYSGSAIYVKNAEGTMLRIFLIGENTITTSGQHAISAEGVRLEITSEPIESSAYDPDDIGTLIIKQNRESTVSSGTAIANLWSKASSEDIRISETARVYIDSVFARTGSGIRAGGQLIVTDDSILDVNVRFGANSAYEKHSEAVYTWEGMWVSTSNSVTLSCAARDDWAGTVPAYALYFEDGNLGMDAGADYIALSSIGKDRAICNKQLTQSPEGYYYSKEDTYASSAVFYRGDYYSPDMIPVNAFFFPDPSFRNYVRDHLDNTRSGWIYNGDFNTIDIVSADDEYLDASTLKGIEFFYSMVELNWCYGNLTEADLSYNTLLTYVAFYDNRLEALNICNLDKLTYLDLDNNLLTMLDVTDNVSLKTVYCGGVQDYECFNRIPVLDFSNCPDLEYLYTRGDEGLRSLNLGTKNNLKELFCFGYETSLELLDISGCPKLVDAYLYGEKDSMYQYFTKYSKDNAYLEISGAATVITSPDVAPVCAEIVNSKLDLSGKIGLRIYFRAPSNAQTARLLFEGNGYSDDDPISISLSKTNNPNYNAAQDMFVIVFPKITSREMTMRIMLTIVDGNGYPVDIYYPDQNQYYDGFFYFCAADWANRIVKQAPSPEAVYMAKALLNYGECAQRYLSNYNAAHPANLRHYLAYDMATFEPDSNNDSEIPLYAYEEGFDYFRLALEADTVIRIYCNKNVSITVDGVSKKVYNSGSTYLALIEGITSRNISKKYEIRITNGSATVPIRYSVLSWANNMISRNVSAAIPTAKALYFYNQAATAYLK